MRTDLSSLALDIPDCIAVGATVAAVSAANSVALDKLNANTVNVKPVLRVVWIRFSLFLLSKNSVWLMAEVAICLGVNYV